MNLQGKVIGHSSTDRLVFIALAIPILNLITTIAVGHIKEGLINPGVLRAAIIYVFLIYLFIKGLPINKLLLPSYLVILTFLLSTILSTNPTASFYVFFRFVIASLLFFVGYMAIRDFNQLVLLNRVVLFILAVQVVYVILSNIFLFGSSDYLDESFFFGETGVNITKEMVIGVFVAPVFFLLEKNKTYKAIATIIIILALIIILIGLKRASLISVVAGLIIYLILSPRKLKAIRSYIFIFILLLTISPYFINVLYERFEARSEKVGMTYDDIYEKEGRILELDIVWNEFLKKGPIEKLFGSGPFLSRDDYFGITRMIHIDYLSVLDGAGIIGLLTFLWVYYNIFRFIIFITGKLNRSIIVSSLKATGITLLVVQLIMGLAGTIIGIGLRGMILLYLGAICGVLQNKYFVERKSLPLNEN